MSNKRLAEVLESLGRMKALVVGDIMLDRYIWGDVERISPEAPVPVLRVRREENRPGGAGSVVANLAALDARVSVVSLVGDDRAGEELCFFLESKSVDISGIARMKEHGTTQKTRLLARVQQLLRVDRDHETVLTPELARRLEALALERVAAADVVLCSDYGKGVLAQGLVRVVAKAARKRGIPCVVDPFRAADFTRYEGATTVTPNRKETENATEIVQDSRDAHERGASALIEKLGLDFATITLDKDGIFLKERGAKRGELYPSQARAVYDVAGAGDMVLSVLGLVLGGKHDHQDAVRLANVAAGLEVERLGVSPISKAEILRELDGRTPPALARKLVQKPELMARVAELRRQGKSIVFTNGCFDLMHAGHVRYFQFCRGLGDALIVAVNTDASVQRNKGPSRPIVELDERATVLAGLAAIDFVVAFDETTPIDLIDAVRPDVLVKGQDYEGKEVVGRELVEASGGRVELAPLWPGVSTTRIIERIARGNHLVDEFLEKLAEDQRRMRKFLRAQGSRFKKMGTALAVTRERGNRIFLVGEPPLDHVAQIIAIEYFQQLPVVPLSLEDGAKQPEPVESGELEPAASEGAGPPLVARHLSRHFHPGDVLVVIAHVGLHPAVKALLGFAKLKGVFAILIGGLEARAALRRAADTAISLPTKGVKTVCEASFVVARILARVARGHVRASTGRDEEERLIRIECNACNEPVFVEERLRGKKGKCPLCDASIKIPDANPAVAASAAASAKDSSRREREEGRAVAVAEASTGSSREGAARHGKSSRRRPRRPLKQSVLNIPLPSDPDKASEIAPLPEELEIDSEVVETGSPSSARSAGAPISGAALVGAAGETSASDNEPPPVGLSSRDVEETVIAPEDVAFDEFANATDSADPFALPDAFVADLVMPQGRPSTGGGPQPSDVNPVVSGERPGSSADAGHPDESSRHSGRLVSARFSVQDCKLRFGVGGFPDDTGPEHPLEVLTPKGLTFALNSEDDMSSNVDKGDELWIRLAVPAFIEPVLVRAAVVRIGGNSGARGTRVELEWMELDPAIIRKLARAAETLGVGQ